MGQRYSIHSLDEARAYLAHPTLGARLKEATEAVLEEPTEDLEDLFCNSLDAQKFWSSMTLFAIAERPTQKALFKEVPSVYWDGEMDEMTVDILEADLSHFEPDQPNDEDASDVSSDGQGQDQLNISDKDARDEYSDGEGEDANAGSS
ncbi:unnamed protein product [Discula destructiva]